MRRCRSIAYLQFILVCSLTLWSLVAYSATSTKKIENYDNHPDLEKAIQYDLTLRDSDPTQASRALAEQHYLAYLEDVEESFQKARVFVCLGDLYAGRIRKPVLDSVTDRNLKEERKIAAGYYRLALEAEPERVGLATINARACVATMGRPIEERLDGELDYYGWLTSINADSLREKVLPWRPAKVESAVVSTEPLENDPQAIAVRQMIEKAKQEREARGLPTQSGLDSAVDGLMKLLSLEERATRINLMHDAVRFGGDESGFSSLLVMLNYHKIINRFPDTELAAEARKQADLLSTRMLEAAGVGDVNDPSQISHVNDNQSDRSIFLPLFDEAQEHRTANVLNLASQSLLFIGDDLDQRTTRDRLVELGKGDLAWNGKLVFLRGAKPLLSSEAQRESLGYLEKAYTIECAFPVEGSLHIRSGQGRVTYSLILKQVLAGGILVTLDEQTN